MDLKDKIVDTLNRGLQAEYVRLEDEDGITGFVVSRRFANKSSLDRQRQLDDLMNEGLSPEERRRVLMIAALTPEEYDAVGARIRVHKVKPMAGNTVEIMLHGTLSDALYVRDALGNHQGVQTTEPKQVPGAPGILMYFRAKGTEAKPLTKEKAIRFLKKVPYVDVMQNA